MRSGADESCLKAHGRANPLKHKFTLFSSTDMYLTFSAYEDRPWLLFPKPEEDWCCVRFPKLLACQEETLRIVCYLTLEQLGQTWRFSDIITIQLNRFLEVEEESIHECTLEFMASVIYKPKGLLSVSELNPL